VAAAVFAGVVVFRLVLAAQAAECGLLARAAQDSAAFCFLVALQVMR